MDFVFLAQVHIHIGFANTLDKVASSERNPGQEHFVEGCYVVHACFVLEYLEEGLHCGLEYSTAENYDVEWDSAAGYSAMGCFVEEQHFVQEYMVAESHSISGCSARHSVQ